MDSYLEEAYWADEKDKSSRTEALGSAVTSHREGRRRREGAAAEDEKNGDISCSG